MANDAERTMTRVLPETHYRRDDFAGGLPVRLADDQDWAFAGPREIARGDAATRAEIVELVAAIAEAEDEAERTRGELALGIFLLGLNYALTPAEHARLLEWPPDDPRETTMRAAFRDLARRHAEAIHPRSARAIPSPGRRFRLPAFRTSRKIRKDPGVKHAC